MLVHDLQLAWQRALRRPAMTAIGVLGLAVGIAVFVVAVSLGRGPFRNPLPGKGSRVYRVLVDHWEAGSSSPYGPPEAPPLLMSHRDARALASSSRRLSEATTVP